jgi:hypothetical protein
VKYTEGSEDPLLQVVKHTSIMQMFRCRAQLRSLKRTRKKKVGKEKDARTVSAQSRRHAGGQGTELPMTEILRY